MEQQEIHKELYAKFGEFARCIIDNPEHSMTDVREFEKFAYAFSDAHSEATKLVCELTHALRVLRHRLVAKSDLNGQVRVQAAVDLLVGYLETRK